MPDFSIIRFFHSTLLWHNLHRKRHCIIFRWYHSRPSHPHSPICIYFTGVRPTLSQGILVFSNSTLLSSTRKSFRFDCYQHKSRRKILLKQEDVGCASSEIPLSPLRLTNPNFHFLLYCNEIFCKCHCLYSGKLSLSLYCRQHRNKGGKVIIERRDTDQLRFGSIEVLLYIVIMKLVRSLPSLW